MALNTDITWAEARKLSWINVTKAIDLDSIEVDTINRGDLKDPVQTSTAGLGNITLSGEQLLNGLTTTLSRVVVTEQTLKTENGIYLSDPGAWTRTTDADSDEKVSRGMQTTVLNATSTKNLYKYSVHTADPISLGTSNIEFFETAPGSGAISAASQAETDAGTVANKYIAPLTLRNVVGLQGFFLSSRGDFGTGAGWADAGFIVDVPVTLFARNAQEKAIFMFYAGTRFQFGAVDPVMAFAVHSVAAPVVTTGDDVRWRLGCRYYSVGDPLGGATDETILQTQTLTTLVANSYQGLLQFTIDRTLISTSQIMQFTLTRLGPDGADTYNSDVGVGQGGLILQTKIFNS